MPFATQIIKLISQCTNQTPLKNQPANPSKSKNHKKYSLTNILMTPSEEHQKPQVNSQNNWNKTIEFK